MKPSVLLYPHSRTSQSYSGELLSMYSVFLENGLILNYILYNRLYLVVGTPSSILSSQIILAVVDQDENSGDIDGPNLFQKLKLMRKVAQKALESAGNEKSFIARPARTARDIIKGLDDDTLIGLF